MFKPPVYKIMKIKAGLDFETIDASCFSKSDSVLFKETVSGKKTRQKGEAKLIYDNTSLYAYFNLEENSPIASLSQHDSELYSENVVELFIDPMGTGKVYYEIEVNPLNASYDALIINDIGKGNRRGPRFQGFTGWNPQSLRHCSFTGPGTWQVFLAIDFADLFLSKRIMPKKGDFWHGNIYRIDYDGVNTEYCAWSPTGIVDFHNTRSFGKWIFN